MTQFAPVREAHRLWLQTQPQMFLEVDDLTTHSGVEQLVAHQAHNLEVAGSRPAPATPDAGTIALRVPGHPLLTEGTDEPLVVVSPGEERPASATDPSTKETS